MSELEVFISSYPRALSMMSLKGFSPQVSLLSLGQFIFLEGFPEIRLTIACLKTLLVCILSLETTQNVFLLCIVVRLRICNQPPSLCGPKLSVRARIQDGSQQSLPPGIHTLWNPLLTLRLFFAKWGMWHRRLGYKRHCNFCEVPACSFLFPFLHFIVLLLIL